MEARRGTESHDTITILLTWQEAKRLVREMDAPLTTEHVMTHAIRERLTWWFPKRSHARKKKGK